MNKLKERWGITSNWELVAIFCAFGVNGTFAARIVKPFLKSIGLNEYKFPSILFWILYILIVFAVYQITLPCSGWLFGQYKFFKAFQEKMLSRIGLGKLFKDK